MDFDKQQDVIRGESDQDVRKISQMTARNYDVMKMIQLRMSELLSNLFLQRNLEADDSKSDVRSMYVDKLRSESCPARICVLRLSEIPKIIPCDTLHETLGCGYQWHRVKACTYVVLSVEIRSGPNVTTGVVSMQWSHISDLVAFRDRYFEVIMEV